VTNLNCSYCGRKGILIYPVRYAVACPNGQEFVPALTGNFKIVGAPADITPAKYTLRALRTGYLYTYEEKRKRLKAYIVMPKGALWEFPIEYEPIVDPANMNDCCLDPVSVSLSYCIDIEPLPCEMMGNIWVGWSNIIWTKSTVAKAANPDWRKKHMQCIDAQAMLSDGAPHAAKFKEHAGDISHFSNSEVHLKKAFDFSNTPASRDESFLSRRKNLERMLNSRCPYGGFIVAVNDPVGIANDLSELTCPTVHAGFDEEIYRGQICTQLIKSLEESVRHDARKIAKSDIVLEEASKERPEVAEVDWGRQLWKVIKAGGTAKYEAQNKSDKQKYGESVAGKIAAAEERAWKEFTSDSDGVNFLDNARIQDFSGRYAAAVKKFEPIGMALANAHSAWLKSKQLSSWMDAVHDQEDLRSGFAYRESLAQCIGNAVATQQCEAALEHWLRAGNLFDTTNLYARALLFNQRELIDAAGIDIRGSDYKPKYILSLYKGALSRMPKKASEQLIDRLALNTANILARALGQASNAIMRKLTLIGLTLLGRTVISPVNLTKNDLSKWVLNEASEQGIKFKQDRTERRANANKEAKRILLRKTSASVVSAFELDVKSLESEGRIRPGTLRTVGIPGRDQIKQLFGSNDFNTGTVGVVLQLCAFYFVNEDFDRADEFDRTKQQLKVAVAALAVIASTLELVANTLGKLPDHPLSRFVYGHWKFSNGTMQKGVVVGKILGVAAGVLNSFFDLYNAVCSIKDGDELLASVYFASGALSLVLAIMGYSMGAAIFWPLFVIAFGFGIAVALIRMPPLKKWVSRCYFSIAKDDDGSIYSSLNEELIAFNSAVGE
jgi:hypothetical protein